MAFYQCVECEGIWQDGELGVEPARPAVAWLVKDGTLRRYTCPACGHHFFEITLVV